MFCSVLCLCLLDSGRAEEEARKGPTLLVVPARLRVIQLAFDMALLRPVSVVAYSGDVKSEKPVLHLWTGSGWRYVSVDDFSDGSFLKSVPSRAILVGGDKALPSVLARSVAWCPDTQRIESLNIADLINALDRSFKFKGREWKRLAGRYELTLIDMNDERRASNPYDIPRSKLPLKTLEFEQGKDDIAPAVVVEEEELEEAVVKEDAPAETPEPFKIRRSELPLETLEFEQGKDDIAPAETPKAK
ncbi:hypothetical protein ACFLQR_02805 [Verrucomicrobiota bacterium]